MANFSLYIQSLPQKGRAMFAGEFIPAFSLIETCPMLIFNPQDGEHIKKTLLYDYYFEWGENSDRIAIALGYGSLYNHSFEPNAEYQMDFENNNLLIYAITDIFAGQEICFNYNGDAEDQSPIWFETE